MMKKEIRGITFFCLAWELVIFGGFITANELAIKNLISAFEWFFYFFTGLSLLPLLFGFGKQRWQYTKAKFHFEIITNLLLGLMLAYYGYFFCATVLAFMGIANAQRNHFLNEQESENENR